MPITIAIDLEGTIISDEKKRIPRPGLFEFLSGCRELARVVIYTMVDPETAREIAQELVAGGHAPEWFADVEWVDWYSADTDHKDLDLIPGSDVGHAFLVDDHAGFVHPQQRTRWVQVMFFDPREREDDELAKALWKLKRKIAVQTDKDIDLTFPGDPIQALVEMQGEIEALTIDVMEIEDGQKRLFRIIRELEEALQELEKKTK